MANVPNGVETLPKILSPEYDARTLQTTDRQTDGRTTTYRERECEFTFAKNETNLCPHSYSIRKIIHHREEESFVGATLLLEILRHCTDLSLCLVQPIKELSSAAGRCAGRGCV